MTAVPFELLGLPLVCVHRSHPLVGPRQPDDEPDPTEVTPQEELNMHAIEAQGLRKTYRGGGEAVKGIDFEVAEGEVFGLLGPNGAGKSTTVGMLPTTIVPTAGSARLVGHDVARSPLLARSVSRVVFQEAVVDRGLTGRANLDLHARLWGVPQPRAKHRTAELVESL